MKYYIILVCTLAFLEGNSQSMSKSDFINTKWFSNNEEGHFYKSDTIQLIQILRLDTEAEISNEIYHKIKYNKNKNISEMQFKNNGKLNLEDFEIETWYVSKLVGKWSFNKKNQTLSLYFKRKLKLAFKVISNGPDKIDSRIDLLVLTLVRI